MTIRSYRVVIGTAVPILALSLASLGRTGVVARDVTEVDSVRRAKDGLDAPVPATNVRLAPGHAPRPAPVPLFGRNLFEFAPRGLPEKSEAPPVSLPPPLEAPPVIPPSPALSLIGVAATSQADGRVERTAIIAGPADALYLVRDGDAVLSRYRVDAVLPDSVRLLDALTGAPVSLLLR